MAAASGFDACPGGVRDARRACRLTNLAAFPHLLRRGHAPLLEFLAVRPPNITPEILEGISEICTWLSRMLVKTCTAWQNALEYLGEPADRAVRMAAATLLDEADWLVEPRGLEAPDSQPERLVMAVEETHLQTSKVLTALECCEGEGVADSRQAAVEAQEAADDATVKMRHKLEPLEATRTKFVN